MTLQYGGIQYKGCYNGVGQMIDLSEIIMDIPWLL